MQNLISILSSHPSLDTLNLSRSSLTPRALDLLLSFLSDRAALSALLLRSALLSDAHLSRLLAAPSLQRHLRALSLAGLGAHPGDSSLLPFFDPLPLLAAALPSLPLLCSLDLSSLRCRPPSPASVAALCGALCAHRRLLALDLSHNALEEAHLQELAPFLGMAEQPLSQLQLSFNNVGDDGVRVLADALAEGGSPQLQALFLAANNIVEKHGIKDVARIVSAHAGLTRLDVSDNRIRKSGAKILFTALEKNNKTLLHVDLQWSLVPHEFEIKIKELLEARRQSSSTQV